MTINLVLVNPNNRVPLPFAAIEPPLWLGLIADYTVKYVGGVWIVDAEAEGLTVGETVSRIKSEARYGTKHQKEILIVVMGNNPSVSSTPKMAVAEELLKQFPEAKLTGLHPIALNHPKSVAKPFKGFPSVPWFWLPMAQYKAHNWHCLDDLDKRNPYAVLYTSLNCPYDCFYCNVHTLYGDHKVRYRPMEDVKRELDYFAQQGIRNIKIWDECFTLNKARVKEICDYIIAQGYDFNMWAYARLDSVEPLMLSEMWMAGIRWLAYGFESMKDKKVKEVDMAVHLTKECGLHIIANYMFGLPGETEADWEASLNYAIEQNFEWINFSVALPYPGSQWYENLAEKPTDWASFSQFSPRICADPAVVNFREKAFRYYFSRLEYLSMIRVKFGEKAEAHIKEMVQWKLK